MNVPKWLIPVLATIAAVAVGVASALFAARFAPPETVTAVPELIDAPVLAPVDTEQTLQEVVDGAGGEVPVSPTLEIRETVDPASVPEDAIPAELAGLLDELAAADDPAEVIPPGAAPVPTEPAGDPCASSDAAGAECPPGTPGTIMTLDGDLPPLQIWSTGANDADCPAPTEPNSVRFWARANAPVTFEMRISQGSARRQTLETTEAQVERWLEESLAGEAWISYCVEVTDLIGDRSVHIHLDATDETGRTAGRALVLTVSDGLDVPPTRIHPIGDSTIFVSAPHTATEVVRIGVLRADDVGDVCTYDDLAPRLRAIREPVTREVSEEFLAERDYEPAYVRRTDATFAAPANTRLLVCIGWFPASDGRPSFDQNTPLRVSEYPMTSPDVVAPAITIDELVLTADVPERGIRLIATTENGQGCGFLDVPPLPATRPYLLCDYGYLLGWHDAGGSLQITTEVQTPEGLARNTSLLDIGLLSCVDGCAGRARSYDVPLSTFIRPARICSDDCRINVGETVGYVRLTATWPASTEGTGMGWQLGDWREGAPSVVRNLTPLLDIRAEVDVTALGDPGDRAFQASAAITVDRAVSVSADLITWGGPGEECLRPGGSSHWESATPATTHRVEFAGLCGGMRYEMVLTLTDADGATMTYRYHRDDGMSFWHGAVFSTPGFSQDIVVADAALSTGDPERVVYSRDFDIFVNGYDMRVPLPAEDQRCWVGDLRGYHSGLGRTRIGEWVAVTVRVELQPASGPYTAETPVHPTRCREIDTDWRVRETVEFSTWVRYDDFVAGPTLTFTDPESGYVATVVITDRL